MYPNSVTYWQVIVPKVISRCKNKCELCGRETFLWITPKQNMEDWDGLENPETEIKPEKDSSLIAVCYKCSSAYFQPFVDYKKAKKQSQLNLSFVDYSLIDKIRTGEKNK